jgi:hypothetical protein
MDEQESIDLAIARSMQDQENLMADSKHLHNFEDAKSKTVSSNPTNAYAGFANNLLSNLSNSLVPSSSYNKCFECNSPLLYGNVLTALGRRYHASCFKCEGCGLVFKSNESFVQKGEPAAPYHVQCAKTLFTPPCCLCSAPLDGMYYRHSYFRTEEEGGGGYCTRHQDSQPDCFSCHRLEPLIRGNSSSGGNTGKSVPNVEPFVAFPDGRLSCHDCIGTAIFDSQEMATIYGEIILFLERSLNLTLPSGMRDVPVLAVDLHGLNEQISSQSRYQHSAVAGATGSSNLMSRYRSTATGSDAGLARGLTISSRGIIQHYTGFSGLIPSLTLPRGVDHRSLVAAPSAVSIDLGGRWSRPALVQTEETRTVTAILVLFGLPRHLTASIIAHEAMHAFFKLSIAMPFDLSPMVEEGMCQYVAHCYLESVSSMLATAQPERRDWSERWNHKLLLYHKLQIETNTSTVYGDGYRKGAECCNTLGLSEVLEFIKTNPHGFPSI